MRLLLCCLTSCLTPQIGIVEKTVADTNDPNDTANVTDTGVFVDVDRDGYPAREDCDDENPNIHPDLRETCDGVDEDCDGVVDNGTMGSQENCPGQRCQKILLDDSNRGDGLYWLDPDSDGEQVFQAWCDMTTDGGGWTRLFATLYPKFWSPNEALAHGQAADDNYSLLSDRLHFDQEGKYFFRLQVGASENWDTTNPSNQVVWYQEHDPYTSATNGSDYSFFAGNAPDSCGGFQGLHNATHEAGDNHAGMTEADNSDSLACWWMQILPLAQYGSSNTYPGYLDSFPGSGGTHQWQVLWIR